MSGYVADKIARRAGPVAPGDEPGPGYFPPGRTITVPEDPDWTLARWPHREDRIAFSVIDFYWRRAVYPVRQVARAILWSTVSVWRAGAVIFTLWIIWSVIHTR